MTSSCLQWRAITRGQVDLPGAIIRDVYDSGWVFSDLDHEAFIRKAAADPDCRRPGPDHHHLRGAGLAAPS